MSIPVKEIVSRWLAKRGYDGICNDDCGCCSDDLFPCDNYCGNCVPAYRFDCERCDRKNCSKRNDDYGALFSSEKDFCKPIYKEMK